LAALATRDEHFREPEKQVTGKAPVIAPSGGEHESHFSGARDTFQCCVEDSSLFLAEGLNRKAFD